MKTPHADFLRDHQISRTAHSDDPALPTFSLTSNRKTVLTEILNNPIKMNI